MAKRRVQPRHRTRRRTLSTKRERFLERVRLYLRAKLKSAFGLDPDIDDHGHDFGDTDLTTDVGFAFLRTIVRREHDLDPELYCCSEVSFGSTDNEEF